MSVAERLKMRILQDFESRRNEHLCGAVRYAALQSDIISLELQTDDAVVRKFAAKAFEAWRADVVAGAGASKCYVVIFLMIFSILIASGVAVTGGLGTIWLVSSAGVGFMVAMAAGAWGVLSDTLRSCYTLRSYRSEAIAAMCCTRNISVGQRGLYIAEPADCSRVAHITCHPFDKLSTPTLVEGAEILSVVMMSEVGFTIPAVMFAKNQRPQAEAALSLLEALLPDHLRQRKIQPNRCRSGRNHSMPPAPSSKGRQSIIAMPHRH